MSRRGAGLASYYRTTISPWARQNAALLLILLLAAVLRLTSLDQVPPGLSPDEAVNGYDAYSLLLTAHDHHGNFLPLTIQGFNDYRMPLFVYSEIPFIALFGLAPQAIRLTAAFWGILNVLIIYYLGREMFGKSVGLISAGLLSISIWHLPFSRYATEATLASLAITLVALSFYIWQRRQQTKWLIFTALAAAMAFYSYTVMTVVAPFLLLALGLIFARRTASYWRGLVLIGLLVAVLTAPYIILTLRFPRIYRGRFADVSILSQGSTPLQITATAVSNWAVHLSPSFLFVSGDRDLWYHVQGFGELYLIQAPFLLLAFGAWRTRKRELLALLFWIVIAAIPAALTNEGLPQSHRDLPAIVPFQLLSAVGFVWSIERLRMFRLQVAATSAVSALLCAQAIWFLFTYFQIYPRVAAARFQYGTAEVVRFIAAHQSDFPSINLTDKINQAYIYVLFYEHFDPRRFQTTHVTQTHGVFDPVTDFDKYHFGDINALYDRFPQGAYVAADSDLTDVNPQFTVLYPDLTPAYRIFVK